MKITRRQFLSKSSQASLVYLGAHYGVLNSFAHSNSSRNDGGGENAYEFIVIGSGAGGGPIAMNLARAGFKVLLLEAGGAAQNTNYTVPAFHPKASEDPALSWQFFVNHYSDPSKQARDSKYVPGKGILYPRGSTLGGSTAVNAMITLYPNREDWDNIAQTTGDSSWDGREMRKHFDKVRQWLPSSHAPANLGLRDPNLIDIALAAGPDVAHLNVDPNDIPDGFNQERGVFMLSQAMQKGARRGTREALLETASQYPGNLIIKTNCLVTRLIFDPEVPTRVIGVSYLEGNDLYRASHTQTSAAGKKQEAIALKEVILSGGAFNSPQLLMVSGIGDRDQLKEFGIDARVHLPGVGKNLQDRYEIGVSVKLKRGFKILSDCTFGAEDDPCLSAYQQDPGASIYGSNGSVISVLKKSSPEKEVPDLCVFGLPGRFRGYYPGYSQEVFDPQVFTWAVLKGHTENNGGYVKLRSSDPLDTPDINFKYFDEGTNLSGSDLAGVLSGLKEARRLHASFPLDLIVDQEIYPGIDFNDDESAKAFIAREAWGHHASCSNKMGPAGDPTAVVDSNFRVHGVSNLRIVDASIFPKIPGLFIAAPTYIISEKASSAIISEYRA